MKVMGFEPTQHKHQGYNLAQLSSVGAPTNGIFRTVTLRPPPYQGVGMGEYPYTAFVMQTGIEPASLIQGESLAAPYQQSNCTVPPRGIEPRLLD